MTDFEKERLRDCYRRSQVGYQKADELRAERLVLLDTQTAIASMRRAFALAAQSQPMRESSGLVEYYKALGWKK